MNRYLILLLTVLFLCSCNKAVEGIINSAGNQSPYEYITYTIFKGQQFCDHNPYKSVETTEMKFYVQFDSSAVYESHLSENQYDINKLYGFSDNNMDHHKYSARIGWRWSDGALRLFAYVYNNGEVASKEITKIDIGTLVKCSIKVNGKSYLFTVNDSNIQMNRASTTEKGIGYQLYPYFGGNETAPHDIRIMIKEE
ncbi:MAG: hypothetical protein ACJ748_02970 [Flavisolibacter sp.]